MTGLNLMAMGTAATIPMIGTATLPITTNEAFTVPQTTKSGRHQQSNQLREVFNRSHDGVIRGYDQAGDVMETHEHAGEFKEW